MGPSTEPPQRLLHLVSSLEVGGKERVVLDLALRARRAGLDHRLLLFDAPYRPGGRDFDPGDVPWEFEPRGPGLDLGFARRVRRRVLGGGYAALHAHNDTAIAYAALAGLPRRRFRALGTFHTKPGHDTPRARRLTRWATGRLDGVVAVSDELAEVLTELGWSRPPGVLWNGVDLERFAPGADDREGPLRVVSLARADPVKRAEDLVRAAELLAGRGVDAEVVLAGDGPRFGEVEGLTAAARARGAAVSAVRRVPDVAGFLRGAQVFCLVSDHEAAPRALLEAMATGLACVTTAVGGMPSMLAVDRSRPAGVVVPPRAPEALADALARLAGDPARRRELGRAARERAGDFSAEREWREHLALWGGGR